MRPYRFLTPANRDLASVLEYLHSNSPTAAERFLDGLDRRLSLLAGHPETGHRRAEFGHPDLRFITFGSYIVAYYPESKPLAVVAILHGSQDLTTLLRRIT